MRWTTWVVSSAPLPSVRVSCSKSLWMCCCRNSIRSCTGGLMMRTRACSRRQRVERGLVCGGAREFHGGQEYHPSIESGRCSGRRRRAGLGVTTSDIIRGDQRLSKA